MSIEQLIEQMVRRIVREELAARATDAAPPEYITVARYAAARSISQQTVRTAVREGRLQALRIGRAVRIPIEAEIGRPARSRFDAVTERARRRLGLTT